ncbi:hypothetical protein ML462_00700 [Gramella lutea]|uniref:Uncharacterized protein n=1 Tax=Christiangramia lutea TaxID=1607951 RepID=A0A9X1V2N9_9FLAO|nr:hypothetical protein [Christiangramia lutea]MCH4821678.1 hypothetical protein [Christiangramia lutea]
MRKAMMDYFKSKGEIPEFYLDPYCNVKLIYGNKNKEGKVWIIEIYNHNLTEILEVKIKQTPNGCKIFLEGNLRKWKYGGKNAVNDLSYSAYCECVELISKRLGVDSKFIYELELNYIEIGGNIKLPSAYDRFIPCLTSYPELTIERWSASSVYFKGAKYRLIFYDKLLEMKDRRIISGKVADRLRKHLFILRFEIKINAKSGYRKKKEIRTFKSFKDNWNDLIEDWKSSFYKAKICDLFSDSKRVERNELNPLETKNYHNFLFTKKVGVDRALYTFQYFSKNRKSEMVNYIQELHEHFTKGDKWHFYNNVLIAVSNKKDSLLIKNYST